MSQWIWPSTFWILKCHNFTSFDPIEHLYNILSESFELLCDGQKCVLCMWQIWRNSLLSFLRYWAHKTGWHMDGQRKKGQGYRRRTGKEKDTSSLLSTCLKGSLDLTSIHLKTKRMKFLTFQELLEVVHKKLSERRPFGSLQSVDELLNFGWNSAADWNTCRGWTHVKSNTKLLTVAVTGAHVREAVWLSIADWATAWVHPAASPVKPKNIPKFF